MLCNILANLDGSLKYAPFSSIVIILVPRDIINRKVISTIALSIIIITFTMLGTRTQASRDSATVKVLD
jgi:hypothetical protein